jgi:hypothetical protein
VDRAARTNVLPLRRRFFNSPEAPKEEENVTGTDSVVLKVLLRPDPPAKKNLSSPETIPNAGSTLHAIGVKPTHHI